MGLKKLVSVCIFVFTAAIANHAVAATHAVLIEGMKFNPDKLLVKKGDTVVWENRDIVPHTVTDKKKSFDSGVMNAGASWKYVPNKAGKFEYTCLLHPVMRAILEVQ